MPSSTRMYAVAVADTRGLNPQKYRVTLVVDRIDEKSLTAQDCAEIEAAFGSERGPSGSSLGSRIKPAPKG